MFGECHFTSGKIQTMMIHYNYTTLLQRFPGSMKFSIHKISHDFKQKIMTSLPMKKINYELLRRKVLYLLINFINNIY